MQPPSQHTEDLVKYEVCCEGCLLAVRLGTENVRFTFVNLKNQNLSLQQCTESLCGSQARALPNQALNIFLVIAVTVGVIQLQPHSVRPSFFAL